MTRVPARLKITYIYMLAVTKSDSEFFQVPLVVFTGWVIFFLPHSSVASFTELKRPEKDWTGNVTLFPDLKMQRKCHVTPFSLIRDFRKQNTRGNVSKISDNHTCYRQIGSKSTNHSPLAWRKEGLGAEGHTSVCDWWISIRPVDNTQDSTDGSFGNVSAGVLFSKVAYQRKRW